MMMSILSLLIILVFVVIFVYFFSKQRRQATEAPNNCVREQKGLDDSLLKTTRVVQFDPKSFEEGLECAVCLSVMKEGEKARILPKCDHGFHMECIDKWFLSHTTCPICRNPIVNQAETTEEQQNSSTVVVVGDEDSNNHECLNSDQASSSSPSSSSVLQTYKNDGRQDLVIDIPARGEGKEDEKTPVSCSRMRSLTRRLSGSRRSNDFNSDSVNS